MKQFQKGTQTYYNYTSIQKLTTLLLFSYHRPQYNPHYKWFQKMRGPNLFKLPQTAPTPAKTPIESNTNPNGDD